MLSTPIEKLINLVESELPHIQYVIDALHKQGLNSGALPEIKGNLKNALEEVHVCCPRPS